MTAEIEQIQVDNSSHAQLDRKFSTASTQKKETENELGDWNLALDMLHHNKKVSEIQYDYEALRKVNDRERQQIDEEFLRFKSTDKATDEINQQIQRIHRETSKRMASLGDGYEAEYQLLFGQQKDLKKQVQEKEGALQALDSKIQGKRLQMKNPAYQTHTKGLDLQKRRRVLLQKKSELEAEVNSNLTPDEIREQLLSKVKNYNTDIEHAEKRIKQLEESLENHQEQIRDKENLLGEAKKHALKSKKYEAVYERDAKMQEFIQRYPHTKQTEMENMKTLQV